MSTLSDLSIQLDKISAQIQSKVAEFLSCKQILVGLKGKGDFIIQNEVNALLRVQEQLETELTQLLDLIQQAKLGRLTIDLVGSLVTQGPTFYWKMTTQIKSVNAVRKAAGDITTTIPGEFSGIPWMWVAIGLGIILILRR